MRALIALALLLAGGPALAHGGDPHGEIPRWSFDPWVAAPLLLALALYALGLARLWRHAGIGRGIGAAPALAWLSGWLVLALALCSPLHWWGEHLFTAHMIEHELVMLLAAPLLVLGRPVGAACWALPARWRPGLGRLGRGPFWQPLWRLLTWPAMATLLHSAAIWLWHVPPVFDATLDSAALHRAQHLSFLLSALLFWWALRHRADPGLALLHLFVTLMSTGVLGALLTFAPRVLYARQTAQAALWGLDPLQDQQLAGLVMWVPGGIAYAAAMLLCLAAWLRRAGRLADAARLG
ncbi:hypothetical protein BKE38_11710 [Pseudoroseomonas deserti]|uniref:Cytochrome c oxidase assembly protein n=1 Tax=Teichococcus deserti TaxID=1817963 RepID=A0A1V2H287_9PROT|nr:cytochrome c oxidase assembly protein [Pseudoroseomonas deserti]ONG53554.1 hypothetical protein BKE38_11710 [Pseudoroseomonas deserti]